MGDDDGADAVGFACGFCQACYGFGFNQGRGVGIAVDAFGGAARHGIAAQFKIPAKGGQIRPKGLGMALATSKSGLSGKAGHGLGIANA